MTKVKIYGLYLFLVISLFVFSPAAKAQNVQNQSPQQNNPPTPFAVYNKGIAENNYLTPLIELQKDEFTKSEQWRTVVPDLLAYLYSYIGEYRTAYAQLDRERDKLLDVPYYKDLTSSPIDDYEPQMAIEAIAALADRNQVVMINEEHDTPMHRAFTTRLLPVLYAKGFRYLAAETFGNIEEATTRGYPTHKTGFYTNDPVFGEMVRAALRFGFKIVPYEHSSEKLIECRKQQKPADFCQNERERGQAQNLYDGILKNDPQAKVLVHVGRGHNQQLKLETWAQMGWHFKDITGITPLSVNQMHSERSEPKYEGGLYRYVVNKWKFTEPSVFVNKRGDYYKDHGYNLVIFHPRSTYENGRPTWLKTSGARRAKTVNLKRLKLKSENKMFTGNEPDLIQALYAGEGADAVPVDQIILYPNKEIPALMLPVGAYRIRAINETGRITGQYEVKRK
jgi:hypothetical protein